MITFTQSAEKKLRSILKSDSRAAIKIVKGPDQRLRLVLEKAAVPAGGAPIPAEGLRDSIGNFEENLLIDVHGQDLVFRRLSADNRNSVAG